MKLKYVPVLLPATLLVFFLVFASNKSVEKEIEQSKETVAIRMIGHEILLQAGDSTSRVLPVKHLTGNEYQLQFENRFSFESNSMVSIIHRVVTEHHLPADYIVNVINCSDSEVIYGFAILKSEQTSIVPCAGRKQVKSCYYVNITFSRSGGNGTEKKLIIAGIGLLVLTLSWWGLRWYNKNKRVTGGVKNQPDASESTPLKNQPFQIGQFLFYPEEQYLYMNDEKTALTSKESALLFIFASAPNQVIDRARLQKEIWEDEGVIVGRSLDMFVSKLRKKLENDPTVRIVNIHGKGYKLDVNLILPTQ